MPVTLDSFTAQSLRAILPKSSKTKALSAIWLFLSSLSKRSALRMLKCVSMFEGDAPDEFVAPEEGEDAPVAKTEEE